MRKYLYKQIFDEDGNTAIIQYYIEDAIEYVENIFTDGTPEMESYVYELGYREWWTEDESDIDDESDSDIKIRESGHVKIGKDKGLYNFLYEIVTEILEEKLTR